MAGWLSRPCNPSRDALTPRERISVAEAELEIGGGAQWGNDVPYWHSLDDLEPRIHAHLTARHIPSQMSAAELPWSHWRSEVVQLTHVPGSFADVVGLSVLQQDVFSECQAAHVAAGGTPYATDRYELSDAAQRHVIPGVRCVNAIAAFYRSLGHLPKCVALRFI